METKRAESAIDLVDVIQEGCQSQGDESVAVRVILPGQMVNALPYDGLDQPDVKAIEPHLLDEKKLWVLVLSLLERGRSFITQTGTDELVSLIWQVRYLT